MIRVKLVEDYASQRDVCCYDRGTFVRDVLGNHDEPRVPPFRNPESLLFIREVDDGHLVDGDWYSYVSPFGRTCMSSLCGGTRYALTVIYNSRKGIYTAFAGYGEDIWQRLKSLDMDILVACRSDFFIMPLVLMGCTIERVCVDGKVYQNAVYDGGRRGKNYTDEAGVFHFNGWQICEEWDWTQHLNEIFEYFAGEAKEKALFPPMQPTALTIPPLYNDDDFTWPRDVLCCSDAFVLEGNDKYPRILGLYKNGGGTFTVTENCPVKYPNLYEAIYDAVKLWRDGCQAAFYVVIDTGEFFSMESFRCPRLWYFEDDGKTVRVYSGMRGLRRLLEFADNSWQDGRMRGINWRVTIERN